MTMPGGSDVEVRAALRDELSGPLEGLRDEVRRTGREVEDAGKKANRGARGFDVMAGGVARLAKSAGGLALKAAAAGVAALAGAAAYGSVKLIGLAMDAAETASKFGTVFAGVPGEVGKYLDDLSKRYGLVTKDLQDAAANFGVFGKAAGIPKDALGAFSKDLVSAGTDLASFYNADPTEVFQALRSGLSGEAEPLRQFGVFLSDATMKAEAATMGLTGELTESQKVMVRQRIIMKSLGDAEGDLERTSGGLSNQWKALKGHLTNAGTAIGTALLPVALRLVTALNDRLQPVVATLAEQLPNLVGAFTDGDLEGAAEVLDNIAGNSGKLKWQILGVLASAESLFYAFQAGGLTDAVGEFDRLTGSGGRLSAGLETARSVGDRLATIVRDVLAPAIRDVASAIQPAWLTPLGLANAALTLMANHTTTARVVLTGLVAVLTVAKAASMAKAAALGVMGAAAAVNGARIGLLTGATVAATGAERLSTAATVQNSAAKVRNTAASVASRTAAIAAATASKVWAAGQWLLNAALTANPIGLVVVAIAGLAAGIYIAYQKSSTFRAGVDAAWGALKKLWEWAKKAGSAVKDTLSFDIPFVGGDTATSRARGSGSFGNTLAAHASTTAATGARPTITNAFVGGGGSGRGSGDHQDGRALDLVGAGLGSYARETRRRGGYAAYHGSGRRRHLHAVPAIGDTRTSMARRSTRSTAAAPAGASGTRVVIGPGAIVVQGLTAEQAAEAVAAGLEDYVRERGERA